MAWVWSFGIKFNCLEDCEQVKATINKVTLSDKTEINLSKYISYKNEDTSLKECTLHFMLENMQVAGNQKLLSYPFYYEIRDTFYKFLLDMKVNFSEALFEFEGADRIAYDEIIDHINQHGIGEILNSDNSADLKVSDTIYQNKRLLDGLVLSNEKFVRLNKEYSKFFKPFKSGYYWLPLIKHPDSADL
ncbi:MAG: hypothetical protein ACOVLG_03230 [Flavobacterium sp.]